MRDGLDKIANKCAIILRDEPYLSLFGQAVVTLMLANLGHVLQSHSMSMQVNDCLGLLQEARAKLNKDNEAEGGLSK